MPQPSRPGGHDRSMTVEDGSFMIGGDSVWVKMSAMNSDGDSGSPWRGGTRTGKTGLWW